MGLFSSISRAIQEGQEKARIEEMEAFRRVENMSFNNACELISRELKTSGSITKRVSWTKVFNERLKNEGSLDEMYYAFCNMYRKSRKTGNNFELNMAQRIGKKLFNQGDHRVAANSEETYFTPKDY